MTEAERLWTAYINAWNSHDIDAIVASVAEQFIYDERPMTMATPIRGRQAFRDYLKTVFKMFPDLRIHTTSCDTGSSLGIAESVMDATYAGSTGVRWAAADGSRRAWPACSKSPADGWCTSGCTGIAATSCVSSACCPLLPALQPRRLSHSPERTRR